MVSREEIERLRQLARQRHRAATRKASRLRAKGVEVTGTSIDPRKKPADISKMRTRDLQAYINRLDKFVSRETTYVSGAKAPLSGNLWQKYQTLQQAVNRKNAKPYDTIKDKFIQSLGMTVDQFQGMKPAHPVTGNPASRAPHLPIQKSPKGIPNDKQLKKLIKDLEHKLADGYGNKILRRDKLTADKMLSLINDKSLRRDVKKLSSNEFNLLWNYTNFASIASFEYEIKKSKMQDKTALSQYDAAFDTQLREAKRLVKDVKALDLVRQSANLTP